MKTIHFFQHHRIISMVVLIILLSFVTAILVVSKNQQKSTDSPVSTGLTSKMDKFKSGTYKPAKATGY
jgi:hypothetical protein